MHPILSRVDDIPFPSCFPVTVYSSAISNNKRERYSSPFCKSNTPSSSSLPFSHHSFSPWTWARKTLTEARLNIFIPFTASCFPLLLFITLIFPFMSDRQLQIIKQYLTISRFILLPRVGCILFSSHSLIYPFICDPRLQSTKKWWMKSPLVSNKTLVQTKSILPS